MLLHVTGVVWLWHATRGWHPPLAPWPSAPVEISLVPVDEVDRTVATHPSAGPPTRSSGAAARDEKRGRRVGVTALAPRSSAPAGPAVGSGGEGTIPSLPTAEPEHPVDLSLGALGEAARQRAVGNASHEEALERLLVPPPEPVGRRRSLDEARAETEHRAATVENVREGRAHPLHFDYLRDARARLTPEATRIGDGLPLGGAESSRGWVRGYLDHVAALNRGEGRDLPPEPPAADVGGPHPDVLGGYREMEHAAESGAVERTAEVCLGVAPRHPVVVTLRRSSGNAALDRLALDSFQSASIGRPVAEDVRPGLACYLVRVSAYRTPPLPSLSLGWKNGRPDIIYPLKRITKVTVDLQSVDYDGPRAPPSLLRSP